MAARVTLASRFSWIARENLERALACEEELKALRIRLQGLRGDKATEFQHSQVSPLDDKQATHCLIAIVFAALAAEARIHDYASWKLGDTFATKHLDRVDLISKLVIATKLATGEDFPKGGRAFQSLSQLIKNRNQIVHAKSAPIVITESPSGLGAAADSRVDFFHSLLENAQEAIEALDELIEVMQKLHPDELTKLWFAEVDGKHDEVRVLDGSQDLEVEAC